MSTVETAGMLSFDRENPSARLSFKSNKNSVCPITTVRNSRHFPFELYETVGLFGFSS